MKSIAALALAVLVPSVALAAPMPQFGSFGALPAATFGGSGIPNDAVAVTTFDPAGSAFFTLGLNATPRFASPAVTNDGAGEYTAPLGAFSPTGPTATYGLWNFNHYVAWAPYSLGSLLNPTVYSAVLRIDGNPGEGTSFTNVPIAMLPAGGVNQNSSNMGFASLLPFTGFSPTAPGVYTFQLDLLRNTSVVGTSLINVRVVPEPGSLGLLAAAMLMPFLLRRSRRSSK